MHQHNNTLRTHPSPFAEGDQHPCSTTPPPPQQQQRIAASGGRSGRRPPHKTTEAQKRVLLAEFAHNPNPPASDRDRIAALLNVERRIVKNWFSNQRALRRKTGPQAGYPTTGRAFWRESSSSASRSSCRSDDDDEQCDERDDEAPRLPPPPQGGGRLSCSSSSKDGDSGVDPPDESDVEDIIGADRSAPGLLLPRTYNSTNATAYPPPQAPAPRRDRAPHPTPQPFVLLHGGGAPHIIINNNNDDDDDDVYGFPAAVHGALPGRHHRPPSPLVHILPCPTNFTSVPRDFAGPPTIPPLLGMPYYCDAPPPPPLLGRYPESALRSSLGPPAAVTVP